MCVKKLLYYFGKYRERAHRVDEALGFMHVAGLTLDHPIIQQPSSGIPYECLPYKQSLT